MMRLLMVGLFWTIWLIVLLTINQVWWTYQFWRLNFIGPIIWRM